MLICRDNNEHFVLTELMSLAPEKIAFTFSERASKTSCYWLFVWGLGFFLDYQDYLLHRGSYSSSGKKCDNTN